MPKDLMHYGQYKNDLFNKLDFHFEPGKRLLDVGCGDGSDALIFINEYKLDVDGIDIYEHADLRKINELRFKRAGIYDLPFPDATFDYVFLHDILHHIDEEGQRHERHIAALRELKRVCKKDGHIIIIEGNRYNPLFYPHMVKMLGHNHFAQGYFKKVIREVFPSATFKFFEAHVYPSRFLTVWKWYEKVMESVMPKQILSYNASIIRNE
ncbi:MAG: class I SAM-dependent methyltransferase [Candidatus Kerfeldbacteria bacterium]